MSVCEASERILFWAFRYALGRMTYAVDDVATEIVRCADDLTTGTRGRILAEIAEARAEGRIGMACDSASWAKAEEALRQAARKAAEQSKEGGKK